MNMIFLNVQSPLTFRKSMQVKKYKKLLLLNASLHYIIKIMPCVEGDRSDGQPEASSITRSRRLRAMVVVEG